MKRTFKSTSLTSVTTKAMGIGALLGCALMASTPASAALTRMAAPTEKLSLLEVVGVDGLAPDTLPEPTKRETPRYPYRALEDGREGWVIVEMKIDENGAPSDAEIVEAAGGPYFNRTSLRALEKFRFKPATLEGKAVAVSNVRYKFTYSLSDG